MVDSAARRTCTTPSRTAPQTPTPRASQRRATPRSTARPIVPREEECWPVTMLLDKYPELRYERWLPSMLRSAERSRGAVYDERLLRGAQGNLLCLWCGRECRSAGAVFCAPPRVRSRFGEGCEHEHRMRRDGQYARKQLFLRDSGVCAKCGIDTHALFVRASECRTLEQRRTMVRALARQTSPQWLSRLRRPLESLEYDFTLGMMWEAAHVIDVRHGGGLCGLDGFRTLCTPCHGEEYVRSYAQDLTEIQSPPSARSRPAVLTSRNANVTRSVQRTPAKECTPLILLDSSPSSTSSSSPLPSPNFLIRVPARRPDAETPTRQRACGGTSSTPTSLRYKGAVSSSVLSPSKTPTKPPMTRTPARRLAAIIDLTGPPTLVIPSNADSELDALAGKITTFNISSSEDSTDDDTSDEDEVEVVAVVPKQPTPPPAAATPAPASRAQAVSRSAPRPKSRARSTSAAPRPTTPTTAVRPRSPPHTVGARSAQPKALRL
ncbi:hypothetical protein H4S01_003392 [Coemansia sp. RSA 2610]|nr:hypothetical protein H4S01_003392 [Coemansia sp. RSA 2610]